MPTTIKIPLPTKGVNKYGTRSEQPLLSTPDALNVLPFDRYGRQRIGQRPGTGKLWTAAIGSGNPVQMIQQTAISTAAGSVLEATTLLSESFTYSDGNLATVSASGSSPWTAYVFSGSWTATGSAVTVASSKATQGISGVVRALPNTTPAVGSSYVVRMTFVVTAQTATDRLIRLHQRMSSVLTTTDHVDVVINQNSGGGYIRLVNGDGTTALVPASGTASASLTLVQGATYVLEARWTGNAYSIVLNGVEKLAGTTTSFSSNTKVGFGMDSMTTPAAATIDDFQVFLGKRAAVSRQIDIFAVANGNVYLGNIGQDAFLLPSGTGVLATDTCPSAASLYGNLYIVDGTANIVKVDIAGRTVTTFTPSAGTETATTLGQYNIAVPWRGRLVLGHDRLNPQNFVASKVGDPLNFDYAATTPDAAWAGNASTAGQISDPITALIPATDDVLLIGTDHGLHAMRGDIADGGSIDLISDAIGVYEQSAWTKGPDGTIYFVGTTGLYAITPGTNNPTLLSDKSYNQFFSAINRKTQFVSIAWDRDRHGCWIFVTPVVSGTATHLFFDVREVGFWPIQYPDTHGPVCCTVFDGDNPSDRYLLMGGRTGFVMIQSDTARRDDVTAISARVVLGPIQPNPPVGDAIAMGLDLTTGEVFTGDSASVWNMNWQVKGGLSAYDVTDGTARRTALGNLGTAGKQSVRVQRIRGGWFSLTLTNSNDGDYFSLERVAMTFDVSGNKQR